MLVELIYKFLEERIFAPCSEGVSACRSIFYKQQLEHDALSQLVAFESSSPCCKVLMSPLVSNEGCEFARRDSKFLVELETCKNSSL